MKGKILNVLINAAENEKDAIDGAIEVEFSGKVYWTDIIFSSKNVPRKYIRNRKAVESLKGKNVEFELDFLESEIKKLDEPIKEIKIPNSAWDTIIAGEVISSDPLCKILQIDCGVYVFKIRSGDLAGSFKIGDYAQARGIMRMRIIKILNKKTEDVK